MNSFVTTNISIPSYFKTCAYHAQFCSMPSRAKVNGGNDVVEVIDVLRYIYIYKLLSFLHPYNNQE